MEAHGELRALREPAAFPRWFRSIVFKHCDRITRRKQHAAAELEAAESVADSRASPLDALEMSECIASVLSAVAELTAA